MRSISRVETESFWAEGVDAEFFRVCAVATMAFAAANRSTIADTDILIFFLRFDLCEAVARPHGRQKAKGKRQKRRTRAALSFVFIFCLLPFAFCLLYALPHGRATALTCSAGG